MNKSAYYDFLAITVTGLTADSVSYVLSFASSSRTYRWSASTGSDRMVIAQLEVGNSYKVRTAVDQYGTQHWTSASPMERVPGRELDVSKKARKTKEISPLVAELLDFGADPAVPPPQFHENAAHEILEAIRKAKNEKMRHPN